MDSRKKVALLRPAPSEELGCHKKKMQIPNVAPLVGWITVVVIILRVWVIVQFYPITVMTESTSK